MLTWKGTLDAKKTGTKDGKAWATLQFIDNDPTRGIKVTDIYLPDDCDHSSYVVGKPVELPVSVSANGGRVFIRAQLRA